MNWFSRYLRATLEDHIVNGEAAEIGEFPFMAAIGYEGLEGIQFKWVKNSSHFENNENYHYKSLKLEKY